VSRYVHLLFNMVSVPGGLLRFWRERRLWGLAERVARLQSPLPEASLRRLLGLIACLIAARYTQTVVEGASARTAAHASSQ
jgi:hypothetical protein